MKNVKELSGVSSSQLSEEILNSTQPLLLRGLVADWALVKATRESFETAMHYLQKFYSGEPVVTYYGDPGIQGRVFYSEGLQGFNFKTAKVKLDEVFNRIRTYRENSSPPTFYVGSTKLDRWFPGFRDFNDLDITQYNPLVSIWIGNQSVISSHFDFPNNIACNVIGRRKFTLFPPEQIDNLYVGPIDNSPAGRPISLVDPRVPDLDKYPKFSQALDSALVAELDVGDALFIPSMWWHHVEGLECFNALINYWWRSTPAFYGNPDDALYHAILSLRKLPNDQRRAWKGIFDYYIFNENDAALDHIPDEAKGILGNIDESLANKIKTLLATKLSRNK